jgi:hypothetical protein
MPSQLIPYPLSHEFDIEGHIADTRYAQALSRVRVEDVIAVAVDILAELEPTKENPLYGLARDVLRFGSCKRSGRFFHGSDLLLSRLEAVLDKAVEMCICDEMWADEAADRALDLE